MWILLDPQADFEQVQTRLKGLGVWAKPFGDGASRGLMLERHSSDVSERSIRAIPGVASVMQRKSEHPLVDQQADIPIRVGKAEIGGDRPAVLIAGPCCAESPEQVQEAATLVAQAGATLLRGGAYKPRSSPYTFAGHGEEALGWLRRAADQHDLGLVTEVLSERDVDKVAQHADLMQIGSRNMQNFALLRTVGETQKPVLLKRGSSAGVTEWMLSAEHLLLAGAKAVIFCERGIRSTDPRTRNLLDLGTVAVLRHSLGQPIVVDPSHAVGRRDLIGILGAAALAAGAHGLLVEAHPEPAKALSDGPQALDAKQLLDLSNNAGFRP